MKLLLEARASRSSLAVVCGCFAIVAAGFGCSPAPPDEGGDVPVPVAPADPEAGSSASESAAEPTAAPDADAKSTDATGSTGGANAGATRDETVAGVRLKVPATWKRAELTPRQQGFIDARFLIPVGETELQLSCSSTGGGTQANVDRWIGQFRLPEGESPQKEQLKIDGADATWVDLAGTFDSGMPGAGGPQDDWRMLGVAIPGGEHDFYLKLVGPRSAVAEVHDEFRAFAQSARLP